MSVLIIDVGTSSIRVARANPDGSLSGERRAPALPQTPAPGLVEFDADALATSALALATQSIEADGPADGVAITNQRASTVVWNPATGRAVAPGQGWQDLRTVGDCLVLAADGLRLAPNHSATKVANILGQVDPDRSTGLLSGTIDTWLAWSLSGGSTFVTDASNVPDRAGNQRRRRLECGSTRRAEHPARVAGHHRRLVGSSRHAGPPPGRPSPTGRAG